MIKYFISQNVGYSKEINNSNFYFYGPNYTDASYLTTNESTNINSLETSIALFGISFDYPLKSDGQSRYFRITANLLVAQKTDNTPVPFEIDYTVYNTDIDIDNTHRFFAIPVDLRFSLSQLYSMSFVNASIEIYNPDPKYKYVTPASLSTKGEYIAATTHCYIDKSSWNDYEGEFNINLYNSSTKQTILTSYIRADLPTDYTYINCLHTTWIKRSDLLPNMIQPAFNLLCNNPGSIPSNRSILIDYFIDSLLLNGGSVNMNSGSCQLGIPIENGVASSTLAPTYISNAPDENCIILSVSSTSLLS